MRKRRFIAGMALALALAGTVPAGAQESWYRQFRSRNAAMAAVQPSWMGPFTFSDARLAQGARFSVANGEFMGMRVLAYGNNRGFTVLGGQRFQFDFSPPSFFRNHSPSVKDGFGNASTQVKYRIASGNARQGNFALSAALGRSLGGGLAQNGMLTSFYCPKIIPGKGFGKFAAVTAIQGVLPSSKIAQQGRVIEWNAMAQVHATGRSYFDIENNAAWFRGGPIDGKMQNLIAPGAFYVVKRHGWESTHPVLVAGTALQIATSGFHFANHNLITEMRILF